MENTSSKQSEGLATSLWNKYSTDIFFRTTCHIIAIQVILTIIVITGLWFIMEYLVRDTSQTLIESVTQMLRGQNVTPESVSQQLTEVRLSRFWPITVITTAIVLSFGFIMVYTALTPTRLSLDRKKRFISNISHELRTPLAIIRTNTDLSLRETTLPGKVRHRLTRNIEEFDRITAIMNNLFGLSNMMQDQHLHFEEADLTHIAQRAIGSLEETYRHKDITLTLKSHTHATVLGNASALEQAVFNLLKNAITHVENQGIITVEIEAASDGKYINLSVADTGPGIPRHDLFHILEPFYRSSGSKQRHPGQGLGLAIVNEIIQMHRGKIKIQSAIQQGTIVTIAIRRSTPAAARAATQDTKQMEEVSLDFSRRILQ